MTNPTDSYMKTQLTKPARVRRYGVLLSARPLNKDEYRILGMVAMMGVLLSAAIVFVAVPRPELAQVTAVCAIPGSLFAGVFCILWDRHLRAAKRPEMAKRPGTLRVISNLAIGSAMFVVLRYAIPSWLIRTIVLFAVIAVMAIARRVHRT